MIIVILLTAALPSCAVDYRTDYEIANGVVLSEEEIEYRRQSARFQQREHDRIMTEKYRKRVMARCLPHENLVICLDQNGL